VTGEIVEEGCEVTAEGLPCCEGAALLTPVCDGDRCIVEFCEAASGFVRAGAEEGVLVVTGDTVRWDGRRVGVEALAEAGVEEL
jgi:hypothetical protein